MSRYTLKMFDPAIIIIIHQAMADCREFEKLKQ